MLPTLLAGYLTASPSPLPMAAATSSPRLPATSLPPRVWSASRIVARRTRAGAATEKDAPEEEWEELEEGFPGREEVGEDDNYDRDPEIADIMGEYFDNPNKAQSRMEERIRKKRHKIVQSKTGSPNHMKVVFNKFDFSNSYVWFEFYHAILPKDVTLICNALRSWYIVGRLGGCNSMNMQLSQSPIDCKTPTYDSIEGANITPTSFYNIGDFEIQDNLARVWVDIGTHEPLLLDILLNALTTINSDHVGIKQLQFGGLKFENWSEDLKTEEAGYSVHKI